MRGWMHSLAFRPHDELGTLQSIRYDHSINDKQRVLIESFPFHLKKSIHPGHQKAIISNEYSMIDK